LIDYTNAARQMTVEALDSVKINIRTHRSVLFLSRYCATYFSHIFIT